MDEYQIIFTEKAERDLDGIVDYLSRTVSSRVKTDFLALLSDKLANLSRMPFMYRASASKPGVRECVVNPQTILYHRVVENRVELLAIQSSRRG
ncbi:type II toxin-antitoxin system RelE/ParE family toxin [Nibrella saemangeumensis]